MSPANLSWHDGENWLSLQEVQMEHLMENASAPTSGSNEYGLHMCFETTACTSESYFIAANCTETIDSVLR